MKNIAKLVLNLVVVYVVFFPIFENIKLRTENIKLRTEINTRRETFCKDCAVNFLKADYTGYDCGEYYMALPVYEGTKDSKQDYLEGKPECKKIKP